MGVLINLQYNLVNKRLPGWQEPPSRELIRQSFRVFDADMSGQLDEKEFVQFANSLMRNGPDAFFARVSVFGKLGCALWML